MKTKQLFAFRNGVPKSWITKVISLLFISFSLFVIAILAGCEKENQLSNSLPSPVNTERRSLPEFTGGQANFITGITNPYLSFTPGKIFHYLAETDEGIETTRVEVTNEPKTILDIAVTVVHDQVFLDGSLIEDTFDWYAQDLDGNVWYFGEDSKEIENGVVISTEGSWEAGVDGAMPGIIMLAEPTSGISYQQEFAEGVAEDFARVLNLNKTVTIGIGTFTGCLKTLETSALTNGDQEQKFYLPGTGLLLEVHPQGGNERSELIGTE